ncbi:MAG: UDP-glucose/GDP-mannose dehydrogenase family protein, partial [Pseudomonadales bacterium]|nr:UDP-glucose/GDP-mannose dehydrogenase family protein [Pseudomonadales bacterium]
AKVDGAIFKAVEERNRVQKTSMMAKITDRMGDLAGKTFAMWGLAFKPETDDVREAPSLQMIEQLLAAGAKIRAFDPKAVETTKIALKHLNLDAIEFVATPNDALEGANALIVMTEWKMFRQPDFRRLASKLADKLVFDGRNIYEPNVVAQHGLRYIGIGRTSEPYEA